jgi:hypothetical protein
LGYWRCGVLTHSPPGQRPAAPATVDCEAGAAPISLRALPVPRRAGGLAQRALPLTGCGAAEELSIPVPRARRGARRHRRVPRPTFRVAVKQRRPHRATGRCGPARRVSHIAAGSAARSRPSQYGTYGMVFSWGPGRQPEGTAVWRDSAGSACCCSAAGAARLLVTAVPAARGPRRSSEPGQCRAPPYPPEATTVTSWPRGSSSRVSSATTSSIPPYAFGGTGYHGGERSKSARSPLTHGMRQPELVARDESSSGNVGTATPLTTSGRTGDG